MKSNFNRQSAVTPASSGGPAELRHQVAVRRNSSDKWQSGGTLMSGGGPGELRPQVAIWRNSGVRWRSGGTPTSGGSPAKLRRQVAVRRNSGGVEEESLPSSLLFFSSSPLLFLLRSPLMGNEGGNYNPAFKSNHLTTNGKTIGGLENANVVGVNCLVMPINKVLINGGNVVVSDIEVEVVGAIVGPVEEVGVDTFMEDILPSVSVVPMVDSCTNNESVLVVMGAEACMTNTFASPIASPISNSDFLEIMDCDASSPLDASDLGTIVNVLDVGDDLDQQEDDFLEYSLNFSVPLNNSEAGMNAVCNLKSKAGKGSKTVACGLLDRFRFVEVSSSGMSSRSS
ncbi:hypothetical protein M5K25_009286 [Dendrobium thyrsiflorum]|uniref:Uncharacterized protein n=1 Tax=Dendrobium thyrsiflorum TaxID=117978 RepID=A0ABD0V5G3_DENTH